MIKSDERPTPEQLAALCIGGIPQLDSSWRDAHAFVTEAIAAERAEADRRVAELQRQLDEANRELHRWQHGQQVEGDYVCEPALDTQHKLEAYKTRVREVLKRSRALALKLCDDPEADQHGWMSREAECVDIADALGIDLESEES